MARSRAHLRRDAVRDRRAGSCSEHALVVVLAGRGAARAATGAIGPRDRGDGPVVTSGRGGRRRRARRPGPSPSPRPAGGLGDDRGREGPAGGHPFGRPRHDVLLDGLTLWLSLVFGDEPHPIDDVLDGAFAAALAAIDAHDGPVVVVSDEIGLGLVPLDPLGRAFRDLLGIAHQRLLERSDQAWFMVAGRPLALVGPEAS